MRRASLSLLALALTASAALAWPTDPAVNQPVCTAAGDQDAPRAIMAGAEETIVAWRDLRAGGQIFAQRLAANGQPMWAADGIPLGPPGATSDPWLVSDGGTGAVIAWIEDDGTTRTVKAQRLSAAGVAQWPPGGVTLRTRTDQRDTNLSVWLWDMGAAAEDGSGGIYLAMLERHEEMNAVAAGRYTTEIVVLHADAAGASGSERSVHFDEYFCSFCGDGFFHLDQFTNLRIEAGPAGAVFVAYRVRRIVNHGVVYLPAELRVTNPLVGWAVTVATAEGDLHWPRIAADPAGGVYASWVDARDGVHTIRASRVSAAGALAWGPDGVPVAPGVSVEQTTQEMFADGDGPAFAWLDGRNGPADVYAQRLDVTGAPRWEAGGVAVCTFPTAERTLAIARTSEGAAAIVWRDVRNATGDVYGRFVSAAGLPLGAANGFPVSSASGEQDAPTIVPAGAQAVAVWRDHRASSADVYAQRIGAPVIGPPVFPPPDLALASVAPNPSTGPTVVRFRLPRAMDAAVWIADLRGRVVARIGGGPLPAGGHEARWDGRDDRGRDVGAGIYVVVMDTPDARRTRRLAIVR